MADGNAKATDGIDETAATARQAFGLRPFVSLLLTGSFLVVLLSGLVLYLSPRGRVANWSNWAVLGLTKHEWSAIHQTVSAVFAMGCLVHLLLNIRCFRAYLRRGRRLPSPELLLALVCTAAMVAGTVLEWPVFRSIPEWNERIKDGHEPAMGNAARAGRSRRAESSKAVGDAGARAVSGMDGEPASEGRTAGGGTAGSGGGSGRSGSGYGRRSLSEICAERGTSLEDGLARLRSAGIDAKPEETIREISDRTGLRPRRIVDCLGGDEPSFR